MPRFPILTPEKCERFLDHYVRIQNVKKAAKLAGANHAAFYYWRKKLPDFDAQWTAVTEVVRQARLSDMEDEAHRRAHDGVDEDVYHQGQVVGKTKKYSDVLLMFLMKAADPRYRDNRGISAPDGGPVQVQVTQSQGAMERLVTFLEGLVGDDDDELSADEA